jgi:phage baseplate assembly protein W
MRPGFIPRYPLQRDTEYGDYVVIDDVSDLVRQNFINLLLTSPGERIMDMEFGVGLKRFLFENRSPQIESTIRGSIESQVLKYMPFVSINGVQFSYITEQPNYMGIKIFYFVPTVTTDQQNLTINIQGNGSLICI